jgi:peroxiredoxin
MKPVLVLLSLIVFCQSVSSQTAKVVLKVGDKAPDFALPNGDGKTVSLSDYTSRGPVVVVFYRGFW